MTNTSDLTQLAGAVQEISRPSDRARDGAVRLATLTSWEHGLLLGPICIALLGQGHLAGAARDFSMVDTPPKDGFKRIRYPKSFRASMTQLTNKGWTAFHNANNCMTQISVSTNSTTDSVQSIFKLLAEATPQEIEMLLPTFLKTMSTDTKTCQDLVHSADKEIEELLAFASELLDACQGQQGVSEAKRQQVEATLASKKAASEAIEKQIELRDQQMKEFRAMMTENQAQIEKITDAMLNAVDSVNKDVPGTIQRAKLEVKELQDLSKNIMDAVNKSVTEALDRAVVMGLPSAGNLAELQQQLLSTNSMARSAPGAAASDPSKVPAMADKATEYAETLLSYVTVLDHIAVQAVKDPAAYAAIIGVIRDMLNQLRAQLQTLPPTDIAKHMIDVAQHAGDVACRLLAELKRSSLTSAQLEEYHQTTSRLVSEAMKPVIKSRLAIRNDFVPSVAPGQMSLFQQQQNTAALEVQSRTWQMSLETSQSSLETARKRFNEQAQELQTLQDQYAKVLEEMGTLDPHRINIDAIVEVLKKLVLALTEFREFWRALAQFFAMTQLTIGMSQDLAPRLSKNITSPFWRVGADLLFDLTVRVDQMARLSKLMASTYVTVSSNYVIGAMAGLSRLAAIDPSDTAAVEKANRELLCDCQDGQKEVVKLLRENKAKFQGQLDAREAQIQAALGKVMPAPSEAHARHIAEARREMDQFDQQMAQIQKATRDNTGLDEQF